MESTKPIEPPAESMTTDARIIHATLTLISEHGLGAVTMSQVAKTAGVARQTLYNHYRDIDGIVAVAINRHNRESLDLLQAALGVADSPTGKIEQMVRHFVMLGSHARNVFDFGGGVSTDVRTALDSYKQDIEHQIGEILEEGRRSSDFRPDLTPEIDTVLTRALLDGIYELAAETPERASQIASNGTRTLLAAIR